MLTAHRVISDRYLAETLRYLAQLVAGDGGYTLRGVSGWAHRHEVEAGTRARQEGQLPRLHAMGLVDRVDVGPGVTDKDTWVYRINDTGARASAETWGDAYERVRVPGALEQPVPVYLARGPLNALLVLRRAYESEGGPRRFGETGWRTGRELTLFVDELNRPRNGERHFSRIDSVELNYLASIGFADKREEKLAWGRDRPVVYWRVSEPGRTARLLCWRASRPDDPDAYAK